jgi:endonuclease YncB( thermonuclease family)
VLVDGQDQINVRLAGIDAPERAQSFGERSKQNLARLVAGKAVEVRWHKRDRYGRMVGQIEVDVSEGCCGSMTG